MRTDNEKWGGNPRSSDSGSGRDGNFMKRDVKSILRDGKKPGTPSRSSYEKPYGSYGDREQKSYHSKPYGKRQNANYKSEDNFEFKPRRSPGSSSGGKFVEIRFDNKKDGVVFRKPRSKDPNYDPNAKYSQKKRALYHQEFVDPTKPVRLNKFLANAGICSRREADEYIRAGVITVNGEIVTELGSKVLPSDKVMFHNQPVQSERKVYLLLNKPKDCVTTSEDKHAKMTVLDLVRNACSERIYPVGRLDRNTTGVLLLTNDGDLASKLMHPKYEKKKIYQVTLDKALSEDDFKTILSGVELEDGLMAADALEYLPEGKSKQVGIEIHSGRNRIVRRLFDKLGYRVVRLDRVYFAGLTKKNLPRGKYRFLSEREVNMLKAGAYE